MKNKAFVYVLSILLLQCIGIIMTIPDYIPSWHSAVMWGLVLLQITILFFVYKTISILRKSSIGGSIFMFFLLFFEVTIFIVILIFRIIISTLLDDVYKEVSFEKNITFYLYEDEIYESFLPKDGTKIYVNDSYLPIMYTLGVESVPPSKLLFRQKKDTIFFYGNDYIKYSISDENIIE